VEASASLGSRQGRPGIETAGLSWHAWRQAKATKVMLVPEPVFDSFGRFNVRGHGTFRLASRMVSVSGLPTNREFQLARRVGLQ